MNPIQTGLYLTFWDRGGASEALFNFITFNAMVTKLTQHHVDNNSIGNSIVASQDVENYIKFPFPTVSDPSQSPPLPFFQAQVSPVNKFGLGSPTEREDKGTNDKGGNTNHMTVWGQPQFTWNGSEMRVHVMQGWNVKTFSSLRQPVALISKIPCSRLN